MKEVVAPVAPFDGIAVAHRHVAGGPPLPQNAAGGDVDFLNRRVDQLAVAGAATEVRFAGMTL